MGKSNLALLMHFEEQIPKTIWERFRFFGSDENTIKSIHKKLNKIGINEGDEKFSIESQQENVVGYCYVALPYLYFHLVRDQASKCIS